MRKLASAVIIAAILGFTVYLLLHIPGARSSPGVKIELPTTSANEEWMGIFIHGQRVGYSFSKTARPDTGLEVENHTRLTILMMNETRTLTSHLFAHTDRDYALKDFSLEMITPGHATKVEGRIQGTALTLTTISQGISQSQTIQLKDKPYFPDALEEVIKKRNLKPGDKIEIPYFDPTTQSPSTATVKVLPKETIKVFDKELSGMRVEIDFIGITSVLWLDDDYRVLKEASPNLGMEMLPLSKEEALAEVEPANAFALLSFFAVKLEKSVPVTQKLKYLKLELQDIDIEGLDLNDDYQKLVLEKPIVIESNLSNLNELLDMKIPIGEQSRYLKPSIYVQSDNPEIIAEAKRIAGDETEARLVTQKLVVGVYNMLKKTSTASLPSAIDVLKTKEGDCNEHAILFTALARALGIPTKIYVGLVNLYGGAYYYHAWCAVWLGKWIPVDPTFNQFPADINHLKLKEGEIAEQAKVLKVVGKLKIDVLEYR